MSDIRFTPIGIIHTPFDRREGMPIQPSGAREVCGHIEVHPRYADGLRDVEAFSHLMLFYAFHRSTGCDLIVKPFMDDREHGVFATRAPRRPNPLGFSVVRLLQRRGARLEIQGIDVLNGTPLLDIKPYVPRFDAVTEARIGWLSGKSERSVHQRADRRFVDPQDPASRKHP